MIRVVAIGDVHANFPRLWRALEKAGALGEKGLPSPAVVAGDIRVVLLGDLVHPKSPMAYQQLTGLKYYDHNNPEHLKVAASKQALQLYRVKRYIESARGNAVIIMGNHDHAAVYHDMVLGNSFGVAHREFEPKYGGQPLPDDLAEWIKSWPLSYNLFGVQFAHAGPTPWLQSYDHFFYQSREAKTWWQNTPEYVRRAGYRFGVYGHTPVDAIHIDREHGLAMIDALDRGQYLELDLDEKNLDVRVMFL